MTDGDVRRALLAGLSLNDPVEGCMHCRFLAVGTAAGRSEVLDLVRTRSLNQIPILNAEGKLVGLHLLREIIGALPRPNWAVIMAGGRGQRLRPLTNVVPKPMVKVAGRPILERIILHLVGFGVRRIFLSVNYLAHVVEAHFGDGTALGCLIEYLREDKPLGTGGSLSLLPDRPDRPLLVLNGDLVTQFDVERMLAYHDEGGYAATIAVHHYEHSVPFAVLNVAEGRVVQIAEKPAVRWPVNAGIYVLAPAVVQRAPSDQPCGLPDLLADCLAQGEPVGAFFLEEDWLERGTTGGIAPRPRRRTMSVNRPEDGASAVAPSAEQVRQIAMNPPQMPKLTVEELWAIERELSAPPFRGVPVGSALGSLPMIDLFLNHGDWSFRELLKNTRAAMLPSPSPDGGAED